MSHTFSQLPNEPIYIGTFAEPFDPMADTGTVAAHLLDALNNSKGDLFYVADMRNVKIKFSDLVVGLAAAFSDKNSPYANPRLKTFTVASDDLIAFGAKAAAEQDQYNKSQVKFYASVDEALAEIRKMTAKA